MNVTSFMAVHAIAFQFARSDWEYVFNTFSFCYSVGYLFVTSSTGTINANLLGLGADLCFNASVQVDEVEAPGPPFTNGEFTAFGATRPGVLRAQPSMHVVVNLGTLGPVRFVDSSFWGSFRRHRVHGGRRTAGLHCLHLRERDQAPGEWKGVPALSATAGQLLVEGCQFQQKKSAQIYLGPGVSKALITGNIVAGQLSIMNLAGSGPNIVIANNAPDAAKDEDDEEDDETDSEEN